nr:unnamed protein product [Naegleria fowleri]
MGRKDSKQPLSSSENIQKVEHVDSNSTSEIKRKREFHLNDDDALSRKHNVKKNKLLHKNSTNEMKQSSCLAVLSHDELGWILNFLLTGEVLMLSFCSKSMYHSVFSIVKEQFKYDASEATLTMRDISWTLTGALRTRKQLIVSERNVEKVKEIVKEIATRGGSLHELSRRWIFSVDCSSTEIFEMLSIASRNNMRTTAIVFEKECFNNDAEEFETAITHSELICTQAPMGFHLKNLVLDGMSLSRCDLLKLLSQTNALEKLEITIYSGTEDYIFQDDENNIYVPILESLKFLRINHDSDNGSPEKFSIDLLRLCPQLETFEYIFSCVHEELFISLAKMCPKLTRLIITCTDMETGDNLSEETIYQLLQAFPKLEHVDINLCSEISGDIFKKISEFPFLKYCSITSCYDFLNLSGPICFGGGILPNLEYFNIGAYFNFATTLERENFTTNIRTLAPNLKEFGNMQQFVDKKVLVDLFADTLTTLELDLPQMIKIPPKVTYLTIQIGDGRDLTVPLCSNKPNVMIKKLKLVMKKIGKKRLPSLLPFLEQVATLFPCITHFRLDYFDKRKYVEPILLTLMENTSIWKDLQYSHIDVKKVDKFVKARPRIALNTWRYYDRSSMELQMKDLSVFYYHWLVQDQHSFDEKW